MKMNRTEEQIYFDSIAKGYDSLDTGDTPIRKYCEVPTVLKALSPLKGKKILELACSDGFFSRLMMNQGASSVTAVDLSPEMIENAVRLEENNPLGIQYKVGSVLELDGADEFDMIFSPFVMSYAKDTTELVEMCKRMYGCLKKGGCLVSMNDNPDMLIDSSVRFLKYGKTKKIHTPVMDGTKITVTWYANDKLGRQEALSFQCNYFKKNTFFIALEKAGFTNIKIQSPFVTQDGLHKFGHDYWEDMLQHPLFVVFSAQKI